MKETQEDLQFTYGVLIRDYNEETVQGKKHLNHKSNSEHQTILRKLVDKLESQARYNKLKANTLDKFHEAIENYGYAIDMAIEANEKRK